MPGADLKYGSPDRPWSLKAAVDRRDLAQRAEAQRQLTKLAPEMAEAILAWDDMRRGGEHIDVHAAFRSMAAKLRAIGGDHA